MEFRYDPKTEKLIINKASRIEYHQINIWLVRKVKGYRFTPTFKLGIWDGNKSHFDNGQVNLGLWKECFKACKEIGTSFNIINKEDFPVDRVVTLDKVREFCLEFFKDHKRLDKTGEWVKFFPYDHQIESAFKILKNRYSLTEVATSGGKTLIISIVYFYIIKNVNPDAKVLIIVPSISLVTQFSDNILEFYYSENNIKNVDIDASNAPIRIDEIMSDQPKKHKGIKDSNIFIGTYQSLINWPKEWFKQFFCVVCDESHMAKGASLTSILERTFTHANYRFGVSGTFPPDNSSEILTIQSVLGPKVSQVEASTLVDKGVITPMIIKVMFLNHKEKELNDKLKSARNPNNGKEIWQYEKKFIQQSTKRLDFIKKLVEKKCLNNSLILFHTIEYGSAILEKLKEVEGIDLFYIDGEVNNKSRKIIFEQMSKTDRPKILVASYGCLSTGLSLPSIYNIILCDSFKSESLIIQSIGRALRLFEGKTTATIYDLVDILDASNMINTLYKHYLERESFYKKRNYPYEILKLNL
jgi:superfamily II DNA or RNA helicase